MDSSVSSNSTRSQVPGGDGKILLVQEAASAVDHLQLITACSPRVMASRPSSTAAGTASLPTHVGSQRRKITDISMLTNRVLAPRHGFQPVLDLRCLRAHINTCRQLESE